MNEATQTLTAEAVTVILVNYRSLDNVRARLMSPALKNQQVIVVDNDDAPDDVIAVCQEHAHATPILVGENIGFAAAVNRAVRSIPSPQRPFLLLNPDASLDEHVLAVLLQELADGVDGVGPLVVETGLNRIQIGSGGGPLTLRSVAYYFLFLSHIFTRLRGVFLTRHQLKTATAVDWLCMACLLVAPDAFTKYGSIPEDEIVYAEDIAWGTLASRRGAQFRHVPTVTVLHESGGSGGRHQWSGALERLCRRRLGAVRGSLAVAAIRLGLFLRRAAGRQVS